MDLHLFTLCLSTKEKRELNSLLSSQLGKIDMLNKDKTAVSFFIERQPRISLRLKNLLLDYANTYEKGAIDRPFEFIEDINRYDFMQLKGAGKKTWNELSSLLEKFATKNSTLVWDTLKGEYL